MFFKRKINLEDKFKKTFDLLLNQSNKTDKRFALNWEDRFICPDDNTSETHFDTHYIYHLAWAARKVKEINPEFHIDISSSLHFCTMLSAFIPVKFYDYRPAYLNLSNLESKKADLMALPFEDSSINCLSCMHTVEHVGLGRYGDPLDYDGDLKAISELKRVVAKDGFLLFVVPVGKSKIMFNAHRIYDYEVLLMR